MEYLLLKSQKVIVAFVSMTEPHTHTHRPTHKVHTPMLTSIHTYLYN